VKRLVALVALFALVPLVQRQVDRGRGAIETDQETLLYLTSGEEVRRLSPGFENVLADIYWLRTVQYFGGQRAFSKQAGFELLEPLINITTTLDPRFELAYRYGSVFLAEPPPAGAGRPRAAVALLERGARALPESWKIRQDLGFFHFVFLGEAQKAARVLLEAAELPGAPYWLRTVAADFLRSGGDRETSRNVWLRLAEETEGQMRENAFFNLQRLNALDAQDLLQQSVEAYTVRFGRRPQALRDLAGAALLRGPLTDPAGVPFAYDPERGTVSLARSSPFWRPS
jgi:hypothetical protein